jgi:hypothetical protein
MLALAVAIPVALFVISVDLVYVLLALAVAIPVALFVTFVVRATDRRIAQQAASSETTMTGDESVDPPADEVAQAAELKFPKVVRWLHLQGPLTALGADLGVGESEKTIFPGPGPL